MRLSLMMELDEVDPRTWKGSIDLGWVHCLYLPLIDFTVLWLYVSSLPLVHITSLLAKLIIENKGPLPRVDLEVTLFMEG